MNFEESSKKKMGSCCCHRNNTHKFGFVKPQEISDSSSSSSSSSNSSSCSDSNSCGEDETPCQMPTKTIEQSSSLCQSPTKSKNDVSKSSGTSHSCNKFLNSALREEVCRGSKASKECQSTIPTLKTVMEYESCTAPENFDEWILEDYMACSNFRGARRGTKSDSSESKTCKSPLRSPIPKNYEKSVAIARSIKAYDEELRRALELVEKSNAKIEKSLRTIKINDNSLNKSKTVKRADSSSIGSPLNYSLNDTFISSNKGNQDAKVKQQSCCQKDVPHILDIGDAFGDITIDGKGMANCDSLCAQSKIFGQAQSRIKTRSETRQNRKEAECDEDEEENTINCDDFDGSQEEDGDECSDDKEECLPILKTKRFRHVIVGLHSPKNNKPNAVFVTLCCGKGSPRVQHTHKIVGLEGYDFDSRVLLFRKGKPIASYKGESIYTIKKMILKLVLNVF